jgi:hypothetical protein
VAQLGGSGATEALMFALPTFGAMAARQVPWGKIIVAGLLLAAAIACAVMYWRLDAALDQAAAAEKAAKAAEESATLARGDATRWEAASGERDRIIASLNEQIERMTIEAQAAELEAIELVEQAQARADATEAKMAEFRRRANEANDADKPRALSPAARAAVEWGLCRARAEAAGTDPGACSH